MKMMRRKRRRKKVSEKEKKETKNSRFSEGWPPRRADIA
jgi:hypothetical protein